MHQVDGVESPCCVLKGMNKPSLCVMSYRYCFFVTSCSDTRWACLLRHAVSLPLTGDGGGGGGGGDGDDDDNNNDSL
jgi:hypothetical protein